MKGTHNLQPIRLGLIVNPLAGVGGPAGLKGSDDSALVAAALEAGAETRAAERAQRCLTRLRQLAAAAANRIRLLTCPGDMGENGAAGWAPQLLSGGRAGSSSAADTRAAAEQMRGAGVDLLLFVGGDGTARDICAAVGEQVPVLGIPAGVKMQSGVFAVSPEAAAEVIAAMMAADLVDLRPREVRDIDEAALREGRVQSRFYGTLQVPEFGHFVQNTKQGGREVEALVLTDIAADLRERLEPDTLYLVGAGTTTAAFMEELQLPATLLGVDVVQDERLLLADASAAQLEQLLDEHRGEVVIIVAVTAGQGSLFGRGNQQLTPRVLRRAGRERVWALATKTKIRGLQGRPLLLDSNDPLLDREWAGYLPVTTGYRDQILYPLGMEPL